jgi:hypothetical protein
MCGFFIASRQAEPRLPHLPRGEPKLMRAAQTFPFNKRQLQKVSYANNEIVF